MVTIQRSAVSGQRSAVSGQRSAVGQATQMATLLEVPSADVTEIKPMLTCCLDPKREWGKPPQVVNGAFSVGELNSPRVAPLHCLFKS
ncbi:hypothetical protein BJP36_35790 [Moorena producens JHB]|uniref:Uncharacterized protein n=1 Tax=Moorena producens (strain JHB) TaxID=1454205 RepID=A0A9Q9UW26_MOOP1|nr:hypothetical protein [Moorena producens]WAN69455.1 hypothetical protein BJP36_35790 [Moorena producens JHB]